jgi:hypothetical protein
VGEAAFCLARDNCQGANIGKIAKAEKGETKR